MMSDDEAEGLVEVFVPVEVFAPAKVQDMDRSLFTR